MAFFASLASDHFVLELDVFQFVDQLRRVRASDHMPRLGQGQIERQVVVQGLRVENAVIGKDLAVQPDLLLFLVHCIQLVFRVHPRGRLVPGAGADLGEIHALDALKQHVVPLLFRKKKIVEDFVNVVTDRFLQNMACELHNHFVD